MGNGTAMMAAAAGLLGAWGAFLGAGGLASIEPGVAHAAAPAPATEARGADEAALDPLPESVALSVFEPEADDRCSWLRVELPSGARRTLATLPVSCAGLHASVDGKGGALVWSQLPGSLFLLDAGFRVSELPTPKASHLERAGFDASGAPIALVQRRVSPRTDAKGAFVLHRGKRIDFGGVAQIGTSILAQALRWDGERWVETELKASNAEACDTLGVDALEAARTLDATADVEVARRATQVDRTPALEELAQTGDGGEWRALPLGEGRLFAWFTGEDKLAPSGLLAAEVGGTIRALETGLDGSTAATLAVRGPYALVVESDVATRVFDARSGALVVKVSGEATFWPAAPAAPNGSAPLPPPSL